VGNRHAVTHQFFNPNFKFFTTHAKAIRCRGSAGHGEVSAVGFSICSGLDPPRDTCSCPWLFEIIPDISISCDRKFKNRNGDKTVLPSASEFSMLSSFGERGNREAGIRFMGLCSQTFPNFVGARQ
jgi:hypothetical protein